MSTKDLNSKYLDKTGFQFDLPPADYGAAPKFNHEQEREELYGAKYVSIPNSPGYKPWLNWPDKFEPDVRFAAISDKNAYLHQFPEVDAPWKFTEYVFKGYSDDGSTIGIIEPPLYSPLTLTLLNGVVNTPVNGALPEENRFCGKLKGHVRYAYKDFYKYKGASGKEYTEEELSLGIMLNGVRHTKWFDPEAPAGRGREFTRTTTYKKGSQYKYKTPESGVRLYKKYVKVKSVKAGQHGNIPKHTVNMSAPREYFEPDNIYSSLMKPVFKATMGTALTAETDGIIDYVSGGERLGVRKIIIRQVDGWSVSGSADSVPQAWIPSSLGIEVEQPRLRVMGSMDPDFMLKTKLVASGFDDGDYIHRGCAFFKGGTSGCSCTIQATVCFSGNGYSSGVKALSGGGGSGGRVNVVSVDGNGAILSVNMTGGSGGAGYSAGETLSVNGGYGGTVKVDTVEQGVITKVSIIDSRGNKPAVVSPVKCSYYRVSETESDTYANYVSNGGSCPYYKANGPREIALYETEANDHKDLIQMFASASPYVSGSVSRQSLESNESYRTCMAAGSYSSSIGYLGAGMLGASIIGLQTKAFLNVSGDLSQPRSMADKELRWRVEYEYVKVPKEGRKTYKKRWQTKPDYEDVVRGTGRLALDSGEFSYGGVDTNFFGDINLLSSWRFNRSVMPCYNPQTCNQAYGMQMQQGYVPGKHAGVGTSTHCRYYGFQCPHSGISRRAYEFDCKYREHVNAVLKPMRMFGMRYFSKLKEYKFVNKILVETALGETSSGPFVAMGQKTDLKIDFLELSANASASRAVFFYYDKSMYDDYSLHKKARIFAHIHQYNHNNQEVFMSAGADIIPSGYPVSIPWLVELHDDYVQPFENLSFTCNERAFFGGRHPEYKDYSAMGEEVMCLMGAGGSIYGTAGGNAQNKGGDPEHAATQDKGYYMGYRIDKSGSYITDGRSMGSKDESGNWIQVGTSPRVHSPPNSSNGATPIYGAVGNTTISPDMTRRSRTVNAYVYSSDLRATLDNMPTLETDDGEGESYVVRLEKPAAGLLPTERTFYRCPNCSYDFLRDKTGRTRPSFPSVDQVVTDFEYEKLSDGKCDVCGTALVGQGSWEKFPEVHAKGVVSVWGLPGQEIRQDSFHWKNPTLISRGLMSCILGKLGPLKEDGSGYELLKTGSASADSESGVSRYLESYPDWKPGLPEHSATGIWQNLQYPARFNVDSAEDKSDKDDTINGSWDGYMRDDSGVKDAMKEAGMTLGVSNKRIDGGEYRDDIMTPNDLSIPGLDFISVNSMKTMRNSLVPTFAYEVGSAASREFFVQQQAGHQKRYDRNIERDWYCKMGRLMPQVMAANTNGVDQYDQFWDGTLVPATMIHNYWPTGPTWWRLNNYIGGIVRHGGTDGMLFDDSHSTSQYPDGRYTGDKLSSKAFYFLHGWLPLDKEIVKAYAITKVVDEPSAPAVGVVWSGVNHRKHYNATCEPDGYVFEFESDGKGVEPQGSTEASVSDLYSSYAWNMTDCFSGRSESIRTHNDKSFGMNAPAGTWGGYLSWPGFGSNFTQNFTEPQLWKTYTFDGFRDRIEMGTNNCRAVCDDPDNGGIADDFTTYSRALLEKVFNQEVQAIPSYMDFTGLNGKMLYPKDGPVFEAKRTASDWNGGQVVIQSDSGSSANNTVWRDGGKGMASAGWTDRVVDITDVVRKKYNARLHRAYRMIGGLSFKELHQHNYSLRNGRSFDSNIKDMNFKYWNSSLGYWLSDPWNYPRTDSTKDFPEIIPGDQYLRKSMDTVSPIQDADSNIMVKLISGWDPSSNPSLFFRQVGTGEEGRLYIYLTANDRDGNVNSVGFIYSQVGGDHNIIQMNSSKWTGVMSVSKAPVADGSKFEISCNPSATVSHGRITGVSGWDIPSGVGAVLADYYKYHPRSLLTAVPAEQKDGSVPGTGSWYVTSRDYNQQYFEMDLLQAPIATSYSPYRYESGYWDISNAICPNKSCMIGNLGVTMAQYVELSKTSDRKSKFTPPLHVGAVTVTSNGRSVSGPQCPACKMFLTVHGAVYTGGDGIKTYGYDSLPDRQVFIKALKMKPYAEVSGVIMSRQSCVVETRTDSSWDFLMKVEWDSTFSKWSYGQYDSNKNYVISLHDSLPEVFTGAWVDGGNLENISASELEGRHFLVPRARYIRYRTIPVSTYVYYPSEAGAPVSDLTFQDNKVVLANRVFKEDEWAEVGQFQMVADSFAANVEPDYSCGVVSNTADRLVLPGKDILALAKWRLKAKKYISACSQFQVYGYETRPGDIVMTGKPLFIKYPLTTGVTEFFMPELPTRIVSMKAGMYDSADIPMTEHSGVKSDETFSWTLDKRVNKETGRTYYVIVSGKYMFDPSTLKISIPTSCVYSADKFKVSLWNLNKYSYNETLQTGTIPHIVEVRYFTGNGVSIELTGESIGSGPSYQIERESICNIAGNENEAIRTTPDELKKQIASIDSSWGSRKLPSMGYSASIVKGRDGKPSKERLYWQVYNHEPMKGSFSMSFLRGDELPAGGWTTAAMSRLFGGPDQERAGLPGCQPSHINGKVSGTLTLYGSPDTIIAGNFYAYALAMQKKTYKVTNPATGASEQTVTYERTGGLKYTGFSFGVELLNERQATGRWGLCFSVPRILVYMAEKDRAVEPAME